MKDGKRTWSRTVKAALIEVANDYKVKHDSIFQPIEKQCEK